MLKKMFEKANADTIEDVMTAEYDERQPKRLLNASEEAEVVNQDTLQE